MDSDLDKVFGYRKFINKDSEHAGPVHTWSVGKFTHQNGAWHPSKSGEEGHSFSELGHHLREGVIKSVSRFHSYSSPEMRHLREQHRQMWAGEMKHLSPEARIKNIEHVKKNAETHENRFKEARNIYGVGSQEAAHAKFSLDEHLNDVDELTKSHDKYSMNEQNNASGKGEWKTVGQRGDESDTVSGDESNARRVLGSMMLDGGHLYHRPEGHDKWILHTPFTNSQ